MIPSCRVRLPLRISDKGFSILISLTLIFTLGRVDGVGDEFVPVAPADVGEEFVPVAPADEESGPWEDYVTDPALLAELNEAAEPVAADERARKEGEKARSHEIVYNGVVLLVLAGIGRIVWLKRGLINAARLKSVYLVWAFGNLMLFIASPFPFGIRYSYGRDYSSFYPFIKATSYDGLESGLFFDRIEQYDISEFAFYALAPVVFWYAVRIWRAGGPMTETKRRGER